MPIWLSILVAVVGLIGTISGIIGLNGYINEKAKIKAIKKEEQKTKEEEELEEYKKNKYKEELRELIRSEINPLQEKINSLDNNLQRVKDAIVTSIRCDMKAMLDRCDDKGFATISEKASWIDLYNDYRGLGGNHFEAYVNQWSSEMESLPTEKQVKSTKQLLVENK